MKPEIAEYSGSIIQKTVKGLINNYNTRLHWKNVPESERQKEIQDTINLLTTVVFSEEALKEFKAGINQKGQDNENH